MGNLITTVLIFAAFAVPAALVWAFAFVITQRSRPKRLALFAAIYVSLGLWWGYGALILVLLWFPATVLIVSLFEWVAAKEKP